MAFTDTLFLYFIGAASMSTFSIVVIAVVVIAVGVAAYVKRGKIKSKFSKKDSL